jgi:hypothetical protein
MSGRLAVRCSRCRITVAHISQARVSAVRLMVPGMIGTPVEEVVRRAEDISDLLCDPCESDRTRAATVTTKGE